MKYIEIKEQLEKLFNINVVEQLLSNIIDSDAFAKYTKSQVYFYAEYDIYINKELTIKAKLHETTVSQRYNFFDLFKQCGVLKEFELIEDKADEIESVYWISNSDMVKQNIVNKIII